MHRACRKLDNNIERAQFIVPLQLSYNQQIQNYYKIIYDTRVYTLLLNIF